MTDSNSDWGDLAEHDAELASAWDSYATLPDAGDNAALDAFVESKNLSVAALARLGARLRDPVTLAYAYAGGVKFRNLETGQKWGLIGSEFTRLKLVRAGAAKVDTVIVAESETDAARLTMLYDADVAIMPAGAKFFTADMAAQLERYDRVAIATDNDAAGEAGAAKIRALISHAVRLLPGDAGDWCELVGDPPAIPAVERSDHIGPIEFIDLTAAFTGELPDPEVIVDDMVYEEGVHTISGHPGSGKSILAKTWAVMVMADGRHVVWYDYEMGPRATGARLAACGADLDRVQRLFHYAWSPRDGYKHLAEVAERWPGALVVFDSLSKVLKLAGLDENSPGEVASVTVPLINAAKALHLPIVIVDHVAKSSKDHRYSRGASSKAADEDVHWYMEKVEEFDRETIGTVKLSRQKDREAYLPYQLWFRVGDAAGNLPFVPTDGPKDEEGQPSL